MKTNKILALASLFMFAATIQASAVEKTYEKEAVYHAVKTDTELTARIMAIEEVSKIIIQAAFEDLKKDLSAEFAKQVKTAKAAKEAEKKKRGKKAAKGKAGEKAREKSHEVKEYVPPSYTPALMAGILPVEVTSVNWDGKDYVIHARTSADSEEILSNLRSLNGDKDEKKLLLEFSEKIASKTAALDALRKDAESAPDEKKSAEYAATANGLSALEFFIEGYANGTLVHLKVAVASFSKAIELVNDDPAFYTGRGYAYENMGQFKLALEDYNRAVEMDPKNPACYNNRGNVHDSMGKHDLAIDDYDKAIELDPKNAKAYSNRGTTYSEQGNYQKALEDFNKSIELDPNVAVVYVNRGVVYNKREDSTRAYEDLMRAARMGLKDAQDILDNQHIKWRD